MEKKRCRNENDRNIIILFFPLPFSFPRMIKAIKISGIGIKRIVKKNVAIYYSLF